MFDGQDRSAHHASVRGYQRDADGDHRVAESGPKHRHDRQRQQQPWKRQLDLDQPLQQQVDPAFVEATRQTNQRAHRHGDADRHQRHQQ